MGYGPRTGSYGPRTASYGDRPSSGGISIVQSASGTTADGSAGLTVNFPVPLTAGSSVIAFISFNNVSDPTTFNTFPQLVGGGGQIVDNEAGPSANGTALAVTIHRAGNVTGGETGITFSIDPPVRASLQVIEVRGLADAAAEDTATNSGDTGASLPLTGLAGTGLSVIGWAAAVGSDLFIPATLTAGWTSLGAVGGATVYQFAAYKIGTVADVDTTDVGTFEDNAFAVAGAAFGGA